MRQTFILFLLLLSQMLFAQDESYDKAVNLFNQANQKQAVHDLEGARADFAKAASLFEEAGYIGNYIQCSLSEAIVWMNQNKFEQAEQILVKIKTKATENYGEENQFMVLIYYSLGQLASVKGDMTAGLEFFEKSLEMNKQFPNPDPYFEANVSASMGNIYASAGDYEKAHLLYLNDLKTRLAVGGDNAPELPVTYNNLSITSRTMGNYGEALEYIEKGMAYSEARGQQNSHTAALLLAGRGSVLFDMGQYHSAIQYMEKALDIKMKLWGERHKTVADEYNNIGMVYLALNDYEKAIFNFRKAYRIQKQVLGSTHPDVAVTCNNLASVLHKDDKSESSLKFYEEAIAITKAAYGESHPDLGSYYHNMAAVYKEQENYGKALEYYRKAESIYAERKETSLRALVLIYINMADTYRRIGEYYTSLNYYQKALAANVKGFNPEESDVFSNPEIANYTDLNYLLYAVAGKADAMTALFMEDSVYEYAKFAYDAYILSDSVINVRRIRADDEEDKLWVGNQNRSIYESAVQASVNMGYLQDQDKVQYRYFKKAFYFSERNKAAILSDALNAADAKRFSGIPDSVFEKERFLKRQISGIKKELLRTSDKNERNRLNDILFTYSRQLDDWTASVETNYPKYYEAQFQTNAIDVSEVQKFLGKTEALRSYFFSGDQLIIFTVLKDDIHISSQEVPSNFEQKVRDFRNYLTSGLKSDFPKYLETGKQLYDILFPDVMPDQINKLIIIPDGILGVIPFEALLTAPYAGEIMSFSDYPFLLKQYEISYYYSAALFLKGAKHRKSGMAIDSWLGLAPVFSGIKTANIKDFAVTELPGTLEELNKIYEKFSDDVRKTKLTGKLITRSRFVSLNFDDYDVLHIATHGIVNTDHPELSGLLFYPEGSGSESILYAGDIYNLQLNNDLVVLSACETGLGKISKSEGIIGLTRSFLYAGAHNIMVSLWKVEDASTSLLMQYFYDYVLKGNSYAKALHLAKLELVESKENHAHPFFWSPFVLIGD